MGYERRNDYPTNKLLEKFVPIKDIVEERSISEETIMEYVKSKRVLYALLKDSNGYKRIPHVNLEQLLLCLEEGVNHVFTD